VRLVLVFVSPKTGSRPPFRSVRRIVSLPACSFAKDLPSRDKSVETHGAGDVPRSCLRVSNNEVVAGRHVLIPRLRELF
jgi:hypothetical protein